MKETYIIGAGGQARETYQIYKDNDLSTGVVGFIVTLKDFEETKLREKTVFSVGKLKQLSNDSLLISAIGNSYKRRKLVEELARYGINYDSIVHNSVIMGDNVSIGEGVVIAARSVLTCDIIVGDHVLVNVGCNVHHDVKLGDYVTLSPGVKVAGRARVGEGSFIGMGSELRQDVTIGKNSIIGMSTSVLEDIPDNTLAYGIPAKPVRKVNSNDWENLI